MAFDTNKWTSNYIKENYSMITLHYKKSEYAALQKYCEEKGLGLGEYVKGLIYADAGHILDKVREEEKQAVKDMDVYFTAHCFLVAVCEKNYLILYPNDNRRKFGVVMTYSTAAQNLAKQFTEKKVNSIAFERWKKTADIISEFDEKIPDVPSLMKSLEVSKYWLIYSSDETKKTELPYFTVDNR